jgi:hypothetical protein
MSAEGHPIVSSLYISHSMPCIPAQLPPKLCCVSILHRRVWHASYRIVGVKNICFEGGARNHD